MHNMFFRCEIITPMFLYGADKNIPELRAPSVKGAMRFWWRAARAENNIDAMKKMEDSIFGDCGKNGRSKFSIVISKGSQPEIKAKYNMLPHHTGDRFCPACKDRNFAFCSRKQEMWALMQQKFQVRLSYRNLPPEFPPEHLEALFKLTSALGGLGRRSRRGFGSFSVLSEEKEQYVDLEYLFGLLNTIAGGNFKIQDSAIVLNKECKARYPYIEKIEIGKEYPSCDLLLKAIGIASHKHHSDQDCSLGSISRKSRSNPGKTEGFRLASPVYVSVLKSEKGFRPVITTLNLALKNGSVADKRMQDAFKEEIL